MSLPERLESPTCPVCALAPLDPKSAGTPADGAVPAIETVYSCGFCERDWLESTDGVWFRDGNASDPSAWGKIPS